MARIIHKNCGGLIEPDFSKTYPYELDDFIINNMPRFVCSLCGKEIEGDPEIEIYDNNGNLVEEGEKL